MKTIKELENLIKFGKKVLKKEGFPQQGEGIVQICLDGYEGSHGFWYEKRKLITLGMDSNKRMLLHEITHAICGDPTKRGHGSEAFITTYERLVKNNIEEKELIESD